MGSERKKYNSLKVKVGNFILSRTLKDQKRDTRACSLQNAKEIGITFKVSSKEELDTVKKAIKFLKNNSSEHFVALGYIPNKKPDDFYLSQKDLFFFSDKDLDLLYRPKLEQTKEFINKPFDILIDLGTDDYYPMEYILKSSMAKFKIGWYGDNKPFDFMLNIDKKKGLDYYCDQIVSYLSQIK